MGASEPQLPTAIRRLARGKLLAIDLICGMRSLQIGFNRHSRPWQRAPGE